MNATSFYRTILRLHLLEAADVVAAGIPMTKREKESFDTDAVQFFVTECGPSRRASIFGLIDQPRTVPVVGVIEDRAPCHLIAAE